MIDKRISELLDFAMSLGISDAKVFEVGLIPVENRFRTYCAEPLCPNYNTSVNCPPHSMTPDQFREHVKGFSHALAFKFDMPLEAVRETEMREASLLLHETTATLEHHARSIGFERASGYSSGACKRTLCYEHADCAALQEGGECRHPDKARPSLSGAGVNWYELSKALGWEMREDEDGARNTRSETIMMAGLVFLE